jgi:AraC family transcriptional activator FtrA
MASRHRVVSVVVDGMTSLEPAVADEFFGIDRSELAGVPWYRFRACSPSPDPVRIGSYTVSGLPGLEALRRADTVIVSGWCRDDDAATIEVARALRQAHRRGSRIASFCTGAFVVAEAGLLDGRPATTHWAHADEFRARFPKVRLDPSVLYVDDGEILTSAGSAASIDLAMHIVRRDFGATIANRVARDAVVSPHRRGGQAQFIETAVAPPDTCPDGLQTALEWATAHLDEDLSVPVLAEIALMSPRHFARQFRTTTGTTPHQWVLTQRLGLAQELLESSDRPVEQVAAMTGFGTGAVMRLHFQRALGTTPTSYRRTFRRAAASSP